MLVHLLSAFQPLYPSYMARGCYNWRKNFFPRQITATEESIKTKRLARDSPSFLAFVAHPLSLIILLGDLDRHIFPNVRFLPLIFIH